MPNHVINVVIPRDYNAFKRKACKSGKVSLNKITPMPKDLDISSPCPWKARKYSFSPIPEFQTKTLQPLLNSVYNKKKTQSEFVVDARKAVEKAGLYNKVLSEYGITDNFVCGDNYYEQLFMGFYNLKKYKHTDWFSWRYDKWGTKWDTYDNYTDDSSYFEFQTAWGAPDSIYEKLAKKLDFVAVYADEGLGNNCGYYIAENGELNHYEFTSNKILMALCVWASLIYDDIDIEGYDYKFSEQDFIDVEKESNYLTDYWKGFPSILF